jgi:hypothetical protein
VIFEIDRGMEDKYKLRQHVRGRLHYIQSGKYKRTFKTDLATIAYATTDQTEEYKTTRRKAMCAWIMELLREMRMTDWTGNFKVASVEFQNLLIIRYLRKMCGTGRILKRRLGYLSEKVGVFVDVADDF